jgi:hypothetical protein
MPSITIKGIQGISLGMSELGRAFGTDIADESISYYAQQSKQRLEQDTPVITGRLFRSTVIRKEGPTKSTLGQFAPYANIVNNRRGYWQGAIRIAQQWPQYYARLAQQRAGLISRKYAGK